MLRFAIAVGTGVRFDVVGLPDRYAARAQGVLEERRTPTPVLAWRERRCRLFWVAHGDLRRQDVEGVGGRLYSVGQWVPVAPTPTRAGQLQWSISPQRTDWNVIQPDVLLSAVGAYQPQRGNESD